MIGSEKAPPKSRMAGRGEAVAGVLFQLKGDDSPLRVVLAELVPGLRREILREVAAGRVAPLDLIRRSAFATLAEAGRARLVGRGDGVNAFRKAVLQKDTRGAGRLAAAFGVTSEDVAESRDIVHVPEGREWEAGELVEVLADRGAFDVIRWLHDRFRLSPDHLVHCDILGRGLRYRNLGVAEWLLAEAHVGGADDLDAKDMWECVLEGAAVSDDPAVLDWLMARLRPVLASDDVFMLLQEASEVGALATLEWLQEKHRPSREMALRGFGWALMRGKDEAADRLAAAYGFTFTEAFAAMGIDGRRAVSAIVTSQYAAYAANPAALMWFARWFSGHLDAPVFPQRAGAT